MRTASFLGQTLRSRSTSPIPTVQTSKPHARFWPTSRTRIFMRWRSGRTGKRGRFRRRRYPEIPCPKTSTTSSRWERYGSWILRDRSAVLCAHRQTIIEVSYFIAHSTLFTMLPTIKFTPHNLLPIRNCGARVLRGLWPPYDAIWARSQRSKERHIALSGFSRTFAWVKHPSRSLYSFIEPFGSTSRRPVLDATCGAATPSITPTISPGHDEHG